MGKKFILSRKLAVPVLAFTLAFGQMGSGRLGVYLLI